MESSAHPAHCTNMTTQADSDRSTDTREPRVVWFRGPNNDFDAEHFQKSAVEKLRETCRVVTYGTGLGSLSTKDGELAQGLDRAGDPRLSSSFLYDVPTTIIITGIPYADSKLGSEAPALLVSDNAFAAGASIVTARPFVRISTLLESVAKHVKQPCTVLVLTNGSTLAAKDISVLAPGSAMLCPNSKDFRGTRTDFNPMIEGLNSELGAQGRLDLDAFVKRYCSDASVHRSAPESADE